MTTSIVSAPVPNVAKVCLRIKSTARTTVDYEYSSISQETTVATTSDDNIDQLMPVSSVSDEISEKRIRLDDF